MNKEQEILLYEILAIPTSSGQEDKLIAFIEDYLNSKGYSYFKDSMGNLYVTKGDSKQFALLTGHLDCAGNIVTDKILIEKAPKLNMHQEYEDAFYGLNYDGVPVSLGADNKSGLWIILILLEQLPSVKACFHVQEETGCWGSSYALETYPEWFLNCSYAIAFDSPEFTMSYSLGQVPLFDEDSTFFKIAKPLILEAGIDQWKHHSFTDVGEYRMALGIPCLNLPYSGYLSHTNKEYLVISGAEKMTELGFRLVTALGNTEYEKSFTEDLI